MPSPMYSADLNLEEPSPKVQEYALHHCGEDPDTRLKAISDLRDIIYERGECTPHRMDDEFLIRFLRARKFIPQRAHRLSCFPVNTYAIHIINHSWVFDKIYNIFKPFLTADMRSKIHFHGYDVTSLHKHILPDHLPERYGGIWPDFSYTIWLESLKKNHKVAKEMITCGYKFREEELCPKVVRQLKDERIKLS
ncbi:hypothetical protein MSG28_002413 [Choristoneura fumiferana]|uniref:Uncharacterized protein n=1 Tax=Choristoneura fumiferana TaxID=7141 RepID=A0ACC0JVM7_CHOFU|nr:hypothetical protein MSG28_002413 [Choristoneura fumiferana]